MTKLTAADLLKLEDYAATRDAFRRDVMRHKKARRIEIGAHLNLYFEDRLTMQYQVQEMLRIERIFEADAIQEELDSYNPLIPDGQNWKATCMLEYTDVEQRKQALAQLTGVENKVWVQVDELDKVFAIADEDLERSTDEKTSAVHFMRFELSPAMVAAVHTGSQIKAGCDHPNYQQQTTLNEASRQSLAGDLSR